MLSSRYAGADDKRDDSEPAHGETTIDHPVAECVRIGRMIRKHLSGRTVARRVVANLRTWTIIPTMSIDSLLAVGEGWPGFLGTRGSFMLDLIFLAMFAAVPLMAVSIWLVRHRHQYELHRRIQLALGAVLGLSVLAFEVDMRLHGWRDRAQPSPYWREGPLNDWIEYSLLIHLAFAVPTTLLWIYVIVQGLRKFPRPVGPNAYSPRHRRWARFAAIEMVLTAATGWVFYYLAFAA